MPAAKALPQASTDVVLFIGGGSVAIIRPKAVRSSRASRTNGVSIQDMWATPTSTPRCLTSRRSALAKCSTPALLALYDARPAIAPKAAIEETTST